MDTKARGLPWSVFKHTKPLHFYDDDDHDNYDGNDDNGEDDGDDDDD